MDACVDREELTYSGIYFLLGNDEDGNDTFYVGQADVRKNKKGVLNRATEPHPEIDYWNTVVAITTKDNSLGGTKISYLENKFYNEAKNAGRYLIKNLKEPSLGNPSEEEEAEMDEFIDYVKLLVRGFGYKIFEPIDVEFVNEFELNILLVLVLIEEFPCLLNFFSLFVEHSHV